MKFPAFLVLALIHVATNVFAMGSESDFTRKTPCPFLNTAVAHMTKDKDLAVGATDVSVAVIVDYVVEHFGVDRDLMTKLASRRAIDGKLVFSDLLDPTKSPVHNGSLARKDSATAAEFAIVDMERLSILKNNPTLSSIVIIDENYEQYVSYRNLKAYQQLCWSLSDMSCKDKAIGKAELKLLWSLFGAYTINVHGTEMIPLSYVYDFLAYAKLPDDFQKNPIPATFSAIIWAIISPFNW